MRMTFSKPAAALLAALATPALALPAFAQASGTPTTTPAPTASPATPGATATPAPAHKGQATHHARRHDLTPAERAARVEARITKLHKELAITTAQQPQWDQFAQVMRDNAKNMEQSFEKRGAQLASMNAADNMQSYADVAVAHAQDVQRLATAFQSLYASLSDSQKQTADALFRHQGPHHPAKAAPKTTK